jgi:hypothetical protein
MAVSVTLSLTPASRTWAQLQAGIYVNYAITGGSLTDPSYVIAFAPSGQPAGRSPTVPFTARSGSGAMQLSPSLNTLPWSVWPPTGNVYYWDLVLVDNSGSLFTELARTPLLIDVVDLSLAQTDYLQHQLDSGIFLNYQILTAFAPATYAIAFAPAGGALSLTSTIPFSNTSGSGAVLLNPNQQTLPWSTWPPTGNCYNWTIALGNMPSSSRMNPMAEVPIAIATAAISLPQPSYTQAQLTEPIQLNYRITNQLPSGVYLLSFVPHGQQASNTDTVPFAPRSGSGSVILDPDGEALPWSGWPPTGNCYDWDIVLCQSTGPLFELSRTQMLISGVTLSLAQTSYTRPQLDAGIFLSYQIAGNLPAGTYVLSFVPHGSAPALTDTVPFTARSGSGAISLNPEAQTLPWSTWPPTGNCYDWDIVLCSQTGQTLTELTRAQLLIAGVTLSLSSSSYWPDQLEAGIPLSYQIENALPAGTYVLSFVPHGTAPALTDTLPFPALTGSGAITLDPSQQTLPWSTWPPTGDCYDWDIVLCSQAGGALAELSRVGLQIVSITLSLAQPAYSRAQLDSSGLTVRYTITGTLPAATYVLALGPKGSAPSLGNTVPFSATSGSGSVVLTTAVYPWLPWASWPPTGNCYNWEIVAGSLIAPASFTPRDSTELVIVEIPTITELTYDGATVTAHWTAVTQTGLSGYQMQLQYPAAPPTTISSAQPTNSIAAAGLTGTNLVVVSATVSGVDSGWSVAATVVDLTPAIGNVTTTQSRDGHYSVSATWPLLDAGIASGYGMKVVDGAGNKLGSWSGAAPPGSVSNLSLNAPTTYSVDVQGTHGVSSGPFSPAAPVLFAIPSGLQLTYNGTALVAHWTALPGPSIYTYTLELSANGAVVETKSQTGAGPALTQAFATPFQGGTVYTCTVNATLGISVGPWSAPAPGPYSRRIVYHFDGLHRLTSMDVTGGSDVVYVIDDLGNVESATVSSG